MCRSIKPLFNFEPPATNEEIHEASLQLVRKISGFNQPSEVNKVAFDKAVGEIEPIIRNLLNSLTTSAEPRDRKVEAKKAYERAAKRFGIR